MLRLLVCGGRAFHDSKQLKAVLAEIWKKHGQEVFLCTGGASGADTMAAELAEIVGWDQVSYPANWKKYGNSAGFIRNQLMLTQFKPDLCIAFPGGKGTENMVKLCLKAGVEVQVIRS